MNSDISNNLSLKYQKITLSGCNDIGIRRFEFVAKTQFLDVRNGLKEKCNPNDLYRLRFKRLRKLI